jgi:hypothetical protein
MSPRFANVSCSQCGRDFGPGDHGFSHCKHHAKAWNRCEEPETVSDERAGAVAERSPEKERDRFVQRPTTSNADEWQLWLQDHAESGYAYKAVQIVEAIEEHQRALAREVYALAEATAERSSDLAMEDSPEGHYSRGMIAEAKSIARAINAIMPYSCDPSALKKDGSNPCAKGNPSQCEYPHARND